MLRAVALCCAVLGTPAAAQTLLERVQGIYVPQGMEAFWDCQSLGQDGGALAIRGTEMIGVENTCQLKSPDPIPGMDAVRYSRSCAGEGMTYEGDPVILTPTDGGVGILYSGFVTEWRRCP